MAIMFGNVDPATLGRANYGTYTPISKTGYPTFGLHRTKYEARLDKYEQSPLTTTQLAINDATKKTIQAAQRTSVEVEVAGKKKWVPDIIRTKKFVPGTAAALTSSLRIPSASVPLTAGAHITPASPFQYMRYGPTRVPAGPPVVAAPISGKIMLRTNPRLRAIRWGE